MFCFPKKPAKSLRKMNWHNGVKGFLKSHLNFQIPKIFVHQHKRTVLQRLQSLVTLRSSTIKISFGYKQWVVAQSWSQRRKLDIEVDISIFYVKSHFGAEFVVSFFSGSRPLALKSSLKSHQMTTFLIQKEYWENNDFVLVKTLSFWIK